VITAITRSRAITRSILNPCHPDRVRATGGSEDEWKDPRRFVLCHAASGNSHDKPFLSTNPISPSKKSWSAGVLACGADHAVSLDIHSAFLISGHQRKSAAKLLLCVVKRPILESLITPVTGSLHAYRSRLNSMFSENWLQQHEVLAAVVFVTLSIALTGFFAWLERRFFSE